MEAPKSRPCQKESSEEFDQSLAKERIFATLSLTKPLSHPSDQISVLASVVGNAEPGFPPNLAKSV